MSAYLEVNRDSVWVWVYRALALGGLAALLFASVQCTERMSGERLDACARSCALSADVAYVAIELQSPTRCMCISDDGSRYDPYEGRTVCAP